MADSLIEKINAGGATYVVHDANAVPNTRKINDVVLNTDITLSGDDVKLTGYTKGSSTAAVADTDKVNEAIAKHENRIDTNQSNILYAIDTGVKNWFVVPDGTYSSNSASNSSVCSVENGVVKIITCTTADTRVMTLGTITLPAGTYKLSNYIFGSSYGDVRLMNPDGSRLSPTGDGVFTIAAETIATVKVYTWSTSALNVSISPFLCVESIYNQDSSYAKPALPNYDLTRLEAEDRAGLIDVIDNGAKNIWNFANAGTPSTRDINYTKTDTSIAVTSTGTGWCYVSYPITLPVGQYMISCRVTNATVATNTYGVLRVATTPGGANYIASKDITDNGFYSFGFTITSQTTYYILLSPLWLESTVSGNTLTFNDLMICTKAAFGVSNKFVPYRLPITGLTAVNRSIACSTTETSTGIKFVATKTAMYKITVTAHYGATKPLRLKIKQKVSASASAYPFIVAESTDNSIALTATGIMSLGVGGEFEIFATYSSAGNNNIYMLVEKLG